MVIYIPQNIDPFNTHLKNLVEAYTIEGIEVIVGYRNFIDGSQIPDIIHFHMVEGILSVISFNEDLFFKRMDFFKQHNVLFLYTLHNFLPHEKISKLNYLDFYKKYLNYIDLFIHHGKSSIEIINDAYPGLINKHHIVCPHGDYLKDMMHFNESHKNARKILRLPEDKKIILIFGQLQYKNTSFAADVFNLLARKHKDAILLMAGVFPIFRYNRLNLLYYRFNNRYLNKFRNRKILIHKRFSQHETYLLFVSANVVFLPHKSGLTTGLIPMAATLGKPFVYANIGVFSDQANYCLAERYECGNKYSAVDALDKILSSGVLSFDNNKWLEINNWGKHVENILIGIKQIQ